MGRKVYATSACTGCGASMVWTVTAASGAKSPVDAEPVMDGTIHLEPQFKGAPLSHVITRASELEQLRRENGGLYKSHFATCPARGSFRRK